MIETHLSFVNTWECDENGHMNVQFFFKRFEEAFNVFATKSGLLRAEKPHVVSRHVIFHNEVHVAESLIIESGVINTGEYSGFIGHFLTNTNSGKICATAIDRLDRAPVSTFVLNLVALEKVTPKGLEGGTTQPIDTGALIKAGDAFVTNYTTIRSRDLDENGCFLTSRIISMFTDGAPHIWERAGVTTGWLNANDNGRVAVEMKCNTVAQPNIGTSLQLISRVTDIDGRTFRIDHQIEEVGTKLVVACGSVRCLVMSLVTRRAVPLPGAMTHAR